MKQLTLCSKTNNKKNLEGKENSMENEEGKVIIVYKEEGGNYRANITYKMKKSTLKRVLKLVKEIIFVMLQKHRTK